MAINQNDKVIRQIKVGDKPHEICSKYLGGYTYDEIHQEIQNSFDDVNDKLLTPIYSNPQLDFVSTSNNVDCFGYVGTLKNINVNGDLILIDSISVYVREGNASQNLTTSVWCRLLKFVNNTWEIVYQSTESKTIGGIAPETLFSFKMEAKDDANKLIKSTDKIAIVYVNSENAQVLSGVKLGFKSISKGGGLQNVLANNSGGNSSWSPAFIIGYLSMADEPKNVVTIEDNQTISGAKNFTSHIGISGKSYIRTNIDPGELKVCRPNTDDGFIIRTSGDKNVGNVYQLQLLTTNGTSSYQYDFPKQNGEVVVYKELSYRELRNLKENSQLVPGGVYRITDYMTYTSTYNTDSGSHQFDILVFALSKNELSENANACLHNGDTYFSSCGAKLESWEIKYCLDNDSERFEWINGDDSSGCKGVIYYMKDEWGNEAHYDFKNILFKKNNINYYTFSLSESGNVYDATLKTRSVRNNKILPSYDAGDYNMILSFNTFLLEDNSLCISNYIGENSKNNTFGNNCLCNTLKSYCSDNKFGDQCQYNILDEYCNSNTFGDQNQSNTLGVNCIDNEFGSQTLRLTFGNKCQTNKFGNQCHSNTFGNECNNNTFGNNCSYNTFENNCSYNTFENNCSYNIFGNMCNNNEFVENESNFYMYNSKEISVDGDGKKVNISIRPNTYYKIINTPELIVSFLTNEYSNGILKNYMFEVTFSGGNTLTLPSNINWANDVQPSCEDGYTYQISIINNLGVFTKFN